MSYNDSSHLGRDEWVKILQIDVERPPHEHPFTDAERSLSIRHLLDDIDDLPFAHALRDVIGLSLARVGMVQPDLPMHLFRQVQELHEEDGIVLIPDSNSLYNGSLHWLLRVLRDSTVWILPFVVSLTQIQERDARLKSLVKSGPDKKGRQALRLRATINSSLSLLQRHKSRYQVLELDPSLLRYLKLSPSDGEGNVLEDRLLIEGVHAVLRATRTRAKQVVITSDVLLARVLEAEGINHLFLPPPQLPDDTFSNVRYDALARAFAGAPLRVLLWDLAHALSSVRCAPDSNIGFQLASYWPGKNPEDWRLERLVVSAVASAPGKDEAPGPEGQLNRPPAKSPRQGAKRGKAKGSHSAAPGRKRAPGDSYLPRASLIQALKVGAAVRRARQGDLSAITGAMDENDRPTPEIVRRALQILVRIKAVLREGGEYLATSVLDELDDNLAANNLDAVHKTFLSFEPYALVATALEGRGRLARNEIEPLLRAAAGSDLNTDAATRLARFHTLLGQAWSDEEAVANGARRPTSDEFLSGFVTAFQECERDGLANVDRMLPVLCRELQMSPWAVQKYADTLVESGGLRAFTLQPAAGRRPVVRDKILSGGLDSVAEQGVPIDRLIIGGRPIFTIGRGA